MSKIVIKDEMDSRVRRFIAGRLHMSDREIISAVRESFDYQHASVYICDMIHHAAYERDSKPKKRVA